MAPALDRLRNTWSDSSSEASVSVLLQATNAILDNCARSTNVAVNLDRPHIPKSDKKPLKLIRLERQIRTSFNALKKLSPDSPQYHHCTEKHKALKVQHRKMTRYLKVKDDYKRNVVFNKLNSNSYNKLRQLKQPKTRKLERLKTNLKTYVGEFVTDGMFDSIQHLKTEPDLDEDCRPEVVTEYQHILDICRNGKTIPLLSYEDTSKILNSVKKNVNDFYSITAFHYLHAGSSGITHFQFLMNTIISNVNLSKLPELNTIYASILYKGHGKDREDARSYRTISTCPLLAKALDIHVRNLSIKDWNNVQAKTQYSGEGMSHELAILLLTETINHSLYHSNEPVYALFLDARSAFDCVLRRTLVKNMFNAGTSDQRLLYLDNRLASRRTFCEFQKNLMGPIHDIRGLEQGGVSSSDAYKIYNNEQAETSHNSKLGVTIFDTCISCVSLADDAVLVSQSIIDLSNLLHLTTVYCSKFDVQLVPEKTNLIAFSRKNDANLQYTKMISPIALNGQHIPFQEEAEHLGVLRSSSGSNMPAIMLRISAHRKKLFSLLPSGMALHNHASPAACLKIERLYSLPVLLSGISALVLNKTESKMLHDYYKNCLRRLMNLPLDTPEPVIYFLAGSLPLVAILHLRSLSLFNMICHLQDNLLNKLAKLTLLTAKPKDRSWFTLIRDIYCQYGLPHPLQLLENPLPTEKFKSLCKGKVHEYWHSYLSSSCAEYSSLRYLQPEFISLLRPHPIWSSLDGNPYQTKAAHIQALLLTGRYRTERLCRFWSSNKDGLCILEKCFNLKISESIEHFLLHCDSLSDERRRLVLYSISFAAENPIVKNIIDKYLLFEVNEEKKVQFLLDCSSLPDVINAAQQYGPELYQLCFKLTRTWCRSLHRARVKKLGQVSL